MKKIIYLLFAIYLLVPVYSTAQTVIRGPYLQSACQESIIVRWRTNTATSTKVWYGPSPTDLNEIVDNNNPTTKHEVTLTGLTANTVYYYAIGDLNGQLAGGTANHFFRTSPPKNTSHPVNIWVLGDAGKRDENQRAVRDAYYAYNGNTPIDLLLLLGDNAYPDGTDQEYQEAFFENMYEDKLISAPMYSCYGNHDAYSASSATETGPYFDIFNFPKNGECGGVPSGSENFFSFDYGDIHFISLNTHDISRQPDGPMMQWLHQDLAAHDRNWLVVIYHHPSYDGRNDNTSDTNTREREMREYFNPVLEEAGADLVLMGHSHAYQRTYLLEGHYDVSSTFDLSTMALDSGDGKIDGDGAYLKGTDNRGTVYTVTGSAGSLIGDQVLAYPAMYYSSITLGSVSVKVDHDQMDVSFISESSSIDDYFTIKKELPPIDNIVITNPLSGFAAPQNVIITTEVAAITAPINEVQFLVNNNLIGTDASFPYSMSWTIPSDGEYEIKAVAVTDSTTYTDVVHITVGPKSICRAIGFDVDDAEEKTDGSVSTSSSDLELAVDGVSQKVGLRFKNLNIPQGSTIHQAHIQFSVDETSHIDPCNLVLSGEDSDNATAYTTTPFDISNRQKTNAQVSWSPPLWSPVGAAGPDQKSPNLSSIVQEIVDRDGYTPHSSIAFIVEGTGKRVAVSFKGNVGDPPLLCVDYTPNYPADTDGDGTPDSEDQCAGSIEPGSPCDDDNTTTYNDAIDNNCICTGTPYDCPDIQVNFGDPCDDNDPGTFNDVYTTDCQCAGSVNTFDCPDLLANIGDPCDDGNPATLLDQVTPSCICVGESLVTITDTLTLQLSSDDAEEGDGGSVSTTSSDLEMMLDGLEVQQVGLRFANPGIPPGANLLSAHIQFTADENTNITPNVIQIYGEASEDALPFEKEDYNISLRPRTNASATWQPTGTWIKDQSLGHQRTSNLSAVIQEIIDQPGYEFNNALAFLMEGTGARVAVSYDKSPEEAARLIISYAFECIDEDSDGICDSVDPCPGSPVVPGTACDDGDPATINDVIDGNCNCSGIVPTGNNCARIASSHDDAEEFANGHVKLTSSDLEMVHDVSDQTIGLRFRQLHIPAGAEIVEAHIQFAVDEAKNSNPCVLSIYGEAHNDPPAFSNNNFNLSDRTKTNTYVEWSPPTWGAVGAAGQPQRTVNIAPVIQEIVALPGYSINSSIVILIEGVGTRTAESFDGSSTTAPELCVEYEFETLNNANNRNTDSDNNEVTKPSLLEFTVAPNPVDQEVRVGLSGLEAEQKYFVQVKNAIGQVVAVASYDPLQVLVITTAHLPPGIYFCTLMEGRTPLKTKRLVVHH